MDNYSPTPLNSLRERFLENHNVRLWMKRDDLIHPFISGNKFRKLKYNLVEARNQSKDTLLTFGGAFSNHIYAVAAAGKEFGFNTIGIIRGEKVSPLNPVLSFAIENGMMLHFISREDYRKKEDKDFLERLKRTFGEFYLIPEGGSNVLAVKGCAEITEEIDIGYDYVCCPCGTGGTLAGLIAGANGEKSNLGFSVLKGINDMESKVEALVGEYSGKGFSNWIINHEYHFGGYAKANDELFSFIREFKSKHKINLDPVYTGKMMFGIYDLIRQEYFAPGTTIIAIHTGGIHGLGEEGSDK